MPIRQHHHPKYLQGYHGLVKTFANNIYYYQDELGSTSHIASATGALIESYQYDLYGKPRVYNPGGTYQPNATPVAKDLGNGGSRWIAELGLYDDRNRFMSPDLGRFLQPDPIGFKGDASNLYRYCGNDWANRTDPMGLLDSGINTILDPKWMQAQRDQDRKEIAHLQGIINQKLSLGYGATQLAGLFNKMDKLQQSASSFAQMTQDIPRFGSWRDAGRAAAAQNISLAQNDSARISSERREYKSDFGQSDTDSHVFTYGPAHRGTYEYVKSKRGWYNVSRIGPPDLPQGFHGVGIAWSFPHHQDSWEKGDRYNLWFNHLHGVMGSPPRKGASGASDMPTFNFYEYKPGSAPPEPPPPY